MQLNLLNIFWTFRLKEHKVSFNLNLFFFNEWEHGLWEEIDLPKILQTFGQRKIDPTKQGRSCNIFHYLALEVISTICYWLQRSALFNEQADCIIVEFWGFILEPGCYTHLSFKVYLFNSVFYSSKLLNYLNEHSLLAITILSLFAVTQCW